MAILAAVDGDEEPDRAVTVGEDLAAAYDDELVVVHVLSQEEFERRDEVRRGERYTVEDGQHDAEATARTVVKASTDRPGPVVTRGRVGDVVEELLSEAERVDAKYLVVGGRKRTPVGKALFGSTTQSVLLSSDVPVVAVMDE
ncbi:universal stress protein [Halopelagius fulvigenes]|uniref:Universal stress protein n=1 Tax=Halopelagius fulvigenes TaxID=1198324 RepID=A0ABD5TY45_9EURY